MKRKNKFLLLFFILLLASLACNAALPQSTESTAFPVATSLPTVTLPQQETGVIPLTESQVPRISVEDARAAFDSGKAILVDVRSPEAYAGGHAEGAINIPLGYFETDIENIPLEKDQWILTYCT